MAIPLTPQQRSFVQHLVSQTGLNSRVVSAWVLAEEGGANSPAARKRAAAGNNNWLNIGYFDSGAGKIAHDRAFADPIAAANATAQFLKGQKFGASSGIRRILSTTGKSQGAQINAIANSGWASSGYNGGNTLRQLLGEAPAPGSAQSVGQAVSSARSAQVIPGPPQGPTPADVLALKATLSSARGPVVTGNVSLPPNAVDVRMADPRMAGGPQIVQSPVVQRQPNPVDVGLQNLPAQGQAPVAPAVVGPTPDQALGAIASGKGAAVTAAVKSAADAIDSRHLPYQWGGGHGGRVNPRTAAPLDCSGAVSAALGIDPRVASQFKHFGSAGAAPGGKGVTIYAKDTHVLMEIDGHFFGTSAANPGGGAGWIPRSAISAGYLKGFTARHLARSG